MLHMYTVTMCASTILSIYGYNICCVQLYLYAKVEYRYTAAMRVIDYLLYYTDTIPSENNLCLFLMYYISRGSATIPSRGGCMWESNVQWLLETQLNHFQGKCHNSLQWRMHVGILISP